MTLPPPTDASLPLPAIFDQRSIAQLRESAMAALRCGPIVLDGAGVERASTAGVHFLLSARHGADIAGRDFALRAPSPALLEALSLLGLTAHFAPRIRP